MVRTFLISFGFALLLASPGWLFGQKADLTATELAESARAAAAKDDFTTAASRLAQLEEEYGDNAETKPLVESLRPLLAMCHVRAEKHEAALAQIELALKLKDLDAQTKDELSFWKAVSLLRTGSIQDAQMELGEYFQNEKHDRRQRYEALLLFGAGFLQLDDPDGAVEFFADQLGKLPQDQRDVKGRATVLYLHALTEAGKLKTAVQVVRDGHTSLTEMPQIISFHTLTLNLGAKLLAEEKYYDAIACLQRVWPKERLVLHQKERLAILGQRREQLKSEGNRQAALVQLNGMMTSIERELANFQEIESFDAALRLRLAQCWLGLEKPHHAALVLEEMLAQMPPDTVVQQGAITLLRCWLQLSRWDKATKAADLYLQKFPPKTGDEKPDASLQEALFSKAEAQRGSLDWAAAEEQFQQLVEQYPESPFAPQALFLTAMCQLSRDDSLRAIATLTSLQQAYAKHELAADAAYWIGMGYFFEKDHATAREQLADYLKNNPKGRYAEEAAFSHAYAAFNLAEHVKATELLEKFLATYPGSPHAGQALLLRGESLLARGESRAAVEVLKTVPREAAPFFAEAWFKAGEALRRMERWVEYKQHFALFIEENVDSPRLAEAVYEVTKADRALGEPERAKERSWETIRQVANTPAAMGVEELLIGLAKMYPSKSDRIHLIGELTQAAKTALEAKEMVAAVRYKWAALHLERQATHPPQASGTFSLIGDLVDPSRDSPRILADVADGYREQKAVRLATEHYKNLRRWHPRSLEKERASLGLAMLALEAGKPEDAEAELDRCLKECVTTLVEAQASLAKAKLLLQRKDAETAQTLLQTVVNSRLFPTECRAEGLLLLGEAWETKNEPAKAAETYSRLCISFGKYKPLAAEGYLRHGKVLKKLGKTAEAKTVFQEALAKPDIANQPQGALLRKELEH